MYQVIHEFLQTRRTSEARVALRQWMQELSAGVGLSAVFRREWTESHQTDEPPSIGGGGEEYYHYSTEEKQGDPFLREDLIIRGALLTTPSRAEQLYDHAYWEGGKRESRHDCEIYLLEDGGVLECETTTRRWEYYTKRKMVYRRIEALDDEDIETIARKLSTHGTESTSEATGSASTQVERVRMNLRWHGGGAQRTIEGALSDFANRNVGHHFIREKTKDLHQVGSDGEKEWLYSITDEANQELVAVRITDCYGTSSDDSEDFDLGTTVIVSSSKPLESLHTKQGFKDENPLLNMISILQRDYGG